MYARVLMYASPGASPAPRSCPEIASRLLHRIPRPLRFSSFGATARLTIGPTLWGARASTMRREATENSTASQYQYHRNAVHPKSSKLYMYNARVH